MDDLELCYLSAMEMAHAIKAKILSPVEITNVVLLRIERLNPKLNAFCTLSENARALAKEAEKKVMKGENTGPLHGVPMSIKDLIFTKGIRTTGGSKIFEQFVPEEDDIVVARLKAAGAIIIGKTNTRSSAIKGLRTISFLVKPAILGIQNTHQGVQAVGRRPQSQPVWGHWQSVPMGEDRYGFRVRSVVFLGLNPPMDAYPNIVAFRTGKLCPTTDLLRAP